MNENTKAIYFAQACQSIGFSVNPAQAALLMEISDLVGSKMGTLTFEELNDLVAKHVDKEPQQEMVERPRYEEQDQD